MSRTCDVQSGQGQNWRGHEVMGIIAHNASTYNNNNCNNSNTLIIIHIEYVCMFGCTRLSRPRMDIFVQSYLIQDMASLDVTITESITLQFQEAISILTGSTTYQGIDGYLCDNVVYPDIL